MKSRYFTDQENWRSLDYEYAYDSSVQFKGKNTYYTAEGFNIPTIGILKRVVDVATNQYSNLYLTEKQRLSDFIELNVTDKEFPKKYVTYFADSYGWSDMISPETLCWSVDETPQDQEEMESLNILPEFHVDVEFNKLDNSMLFEVELLDATILRVSHWDGYKRTYLTVNPTLSTLYFDFDTLDHTLSGRDSLQIFEYSYDEETQYLSLYKLWRGVYHDFLKVDKHIVMSTAVGTRFLPNSFKNINIPAKESTLDIAENWVGYTQELSQNNLNISQSRSHADIVHNYTLNTQYVYNDLTSHKINFMPMKNHITNHKQIARTNPFRNSSTYEVSDLETEPETLFRDYTCLSTGTNQIRGYENIYSSFRDYTDLLVFESDKVTYFHMPHDIYPYKKINVNDAGLIESGAIAGDSPAVSDKVFKKRANYKYHSEWGNSVDEQSGVYLCTWLYWSANPDEDPIWVDRYYNPKEYTIYQAVTATPLIKFITSFDNMLLDNEDVEQYVVFDKVSDLCFEPGVLYCYHRLGKTDIHNSLQATERNLIQKDFNTYKYLSLNTDAPLEYDVTTSIYNFTGTEYATTPILSDLTMNNSFCVSFSMYSEQWSQPFGNQILGNYNNTGFGIFNQLLYTPLYLTVGQATTLRNTDTDVVLTLPLTSRHIFKSSLNDNVIIYNDDFGGSMYTYDLAGVLHDRETIEIYDTTVYPPERLTPLYISNDDMYLYLVYNETSYITVHLQTGMRELHADSIVNISTDMQTKQFTGIKSIIVSDKTVYAVDADKHDIKYIGSDMYWLDGNSLVRYNITEGLYYTVLRSTDYYIKTFTVDRHNNKYILYRELQRDPVIWDVKQQTHYNHYIIKLDHYDEVKSNTNIATYSELMSGMSRDTDFVMYSGVEDLGGTQTDMVYLYTDYLSTVDVYNEGSNSFIQVDQNVTLHTYIGNDTDIYNSARLQTIDFYRQIDNNYNTIINKAKYTDLTNPMIFKLKLVNTYNKDLVEDVDMGVDVSELDSGWHHFVYDFSSILGKAIVFIDGRVVGTYDTTPNMYRFSDTSIQQYSIGATTGFAGVLFNEFLNQPGRYVTKNYKLKEFRLYNKSMNYYSMKFFYRQITGINDMKWTIPCNSRNHIDEIQHVFNHTNGYVKSNTFDINILTDNIAGDDIKQELSEDIKIQLYDQLPNRAEVGNINWHVTR